MTLEQIAKTKGFVVGTIVNHLESLVNSGYKLDLERVKPEEGRLMIMKAAFAKTSDEKLSPVKEILGDDFSYDEIRLARLFL